MNLSNTEFQTVTTTDKDAALAAVSFEVLREKLSFPFQGSQVESDRDVLFRLGNKGEVQRLGYASPDYKIIPHKEALEVAFSALDQSGLPYQLSKVDLDRNGAKMYVQFKMLSGYEITPGNKGDTLFPILTLVNSYDGGNKLGFDLESIRLVCLNLARAVSKDLSLRFMHTASADPQKLLEAARQGLIGFENKIVPFYRQLASVKVSQEQAVAAVAVAVKEEVIPLNVAVFARHCVESNTAEKEGIERTMWALFNAFTWASTTRGQVISPTRAREIRGKVGNLFADGGKDLISKASNIKQDTIKEVFAKVAA